MPYTRNARGRRVQVAPATIAALISKAYQEALGSSGIVHARPEIMGHAQEVLRLMETRHGSGPDHEWTPAALQRVVIDRLQKAPVGVLEAFLQSQGLAVPSRTTRADRWGEFAARIPEQVLDPIWDLRRVRERTTEVPQAVTNLETLGGGVVRAPKKAEAVLRQPWCRSHWLDFLDKVAAQHLQPIDTATLRAHVLSLPPEEHRRSIEGWWNYWNELLHSLLIRDPDLLNLIHILQQRRWRAGVFGQEWCAGMPGTDPLRLEFSATGDAHYRRFAVQHLRELFAHLPLDDGQWSKWGRVLDPQGDLRVPWQGTVWMEDQEGLWPLRLEAAPAGAHELPQWAYARLALALAAEEADVFERAKAFYLAFSRQEIAPSEAMLRTAGTPSPRWMEDQAIRVQDDFEDIHGAIFRSAVDTKWTGTVALDWSAVRGAGSEVGGRRSAKGVLGFVRTIDAALDAQGREPGDHPVTVSLPVWHPEVENWLKLREAAPRVQSVLLLSDAFLQTVADGGSWTLLDPSVYPECQDGSEGYRLALTKIPERKADNPRAHRVISAPRLWSKVVTSVQAGGMFLTFVDADRAFAPFLDMAPPVSGLEGVGALPLPAESRRDQRISWPSLAVNLRATLDPQGLPVPEEMRRIVATAMRMADNMIEQSADASPATLEYRPVCVGAIGFFEAVQSANEQTRGQPEEVAAWITRLCQAWATALLRADKDLTRERGPSPWASHGQSLSPQVAVQRLRRARGGGLGMQLENPEGWERFDRLVDEAQRFSVRTVWAPFEGAARITGVTPGGMGTLRAIDVVSTPQGERRVPSPLWHSLREAFPDEDWAEILDPAISQDTWPLALRELVSPDAAGWEVRLRHAALVRPWIDQGVSLTLPTNIPEGALAVIIQRAWWFGLSNLRFHSPLASPPGPSSAAPR